MAEYRNNTRLIFWAAVFLYCCLFHERCHGDGSYENITDLMDNVLGSKSNYNPDIRPRDFHSDIVIVTVGFSMVSLLEIDDVKQSFKMNGFLLLNWNDERVMWDKTEYGNADYLAPQPKNIWRPRMVMLNTLKDRDMFKDDYCPLTAYSNGYVFWMPGGLFEASCALDMSKYPFDEQTCSMVFCPLGHSVRQLEFIPAKESFDLDFFVQNEAWEVTSNEINIINITSELTETVSCPSFTFTVKRRPGYFMVNFILPVLMLSFLNNFVFLIPDESGEKIGYGITVLLSVSVFLTTLSTMVPRSSNNIPAVTIYLFILILFSGISVLLSIGTVFLQRAEEDETVHLKAQDNYKQGVKKLTGLRRALGKIEPVENPRSSRETRKSLTPSEMDITLSTSNESPPNNNEPPPKNKYHVITKHVNKICFVLSMAMWSITQIVFFVYANS